jgi:anhydro-N-acetylmuramic acid kinase
MQHTYTAIGLMSGSSLDGLDICCVQFIKTEKSFQYHILHSTCIEYDANFRTELKEATQLSAIDLACLHASLGRYFAKEVVAFIETNKISNIDFICSHGQTIFHQPKKRFTTQIGCGAAIAQLSGITTISDLRTADVAQGGQGAPIVPIAEKYLFPNVNVFLNIGGICNISFHDTISEQIIAYDVCAGNTLLNYLAAKKGFAYDDNGNIASKGQVHQELLDELNNIVFCKQNAPKSLGTEHVIEFWINKTEEYNISVEDKMATCVEHIAMQIATEIKKHTTEEQQLLITGGGAFNSFLANRIKHHSKCTIIDTDHKTIQYKEALAIAFFGLLRVLEIPNCLSSVTGASKNVIGGALYLP